MFSKLLLFTYVVLAGVIKLSLGDQHSIILGQGGRVWSTTIVLRGQALPPGASQDFVQVMPSGATAVDAGSGFSLVLKRGC